MYDIGKPDICIGHIYMDYKVDGIVRDGVTTNSIIYNASDQNTGEKLILKCIKKSVMGIMSDYEIYISTIFSHPNLMKGHSYFETERFKCFFMPYAESGDLFNYLIESPILPECHVQAFAAQMISGLHYMHSLGIMHGDIKLENFFLKYDINAPNIHFNIILGDFGYSRQLKPGEKLRHVYGTKPYFSPEMMQKNPKYDFAADIWALGVCLFSLLTKSVPFGSHEDNDFHLFKQKVMAGEYDEDLLEDLSHDAKDVIRMCLTPDPDQRISIQDLLTHEWINQKPPVPDPDPDPDPNPDPFPDPDPDSFPDPDSDTPYPF